VSLTQIGADYRWLSRHFDINAFEFGVVAVGQHERVVKVESPEHAAALSAGPCLLTRNGPDARGVLGMTIRPRRRVGTRDLARRGTLVQRNRRSTAVAASTLKNACGASDGDQESPGG